MKHLLSKLGLDIHYHKSYSQEGEDMVLRAIFGKQTTGTYVDIGACHPIQGNNTYHFYKKGWRGINIEPNPVMFELLKKKRPHDLNLNGGIGKEYDMKDYYMFDTHVVNTFSVEWVNGILNNPNSKCRFTKMIQVPIFPLNEVPKIGMNQIDFMSIDVEGYEKEVLMSNDWDKYRPKILVVETDLDEFVESFGYKLFRWTGLSRFYIGTKPLA